MKEELQVLKKGNVGIGILQNMKLTRGIHTHYRTGYRVWYMEVEIHHRDRISIIWQGEEWWKVGGVKKYEHNVVSFMIPEEWKRWFVVGECMPPNNQLTVHQVEQVLL